MLEQLKKESNKTFTENGAAAYASTNSYCLDLFSTIGALRGASEAEIIQRFVRAYAEDPDMAMKILFYARDIRGGLGERRVFRTIIRYLAGGGTESIAKNICYIPEFGRLDDILELMGTGYSKNAIELIRKQLEEDSSAMAVGKEISLMAKWLPSINASDKKTIAMARKVADALGMSCAEYRKKLSAMRAYIKIIENNLREKDYTFDYSKQPSKAMFKYRAAFFRNDNERYKEFLEKVEEGKAVLHTGTLTPYDIITPLLGRNINEEDKRSADVTWKAQEDFTNDENAIVVADGSGSMYDYYVNETIPAAVAMSLAIYFAERSKGGFNGHFITFSEDPTLVEIKGKDIAEKVSYCASFNEVANTNIERVFDLILNTAVKNRMTQAELPSTMYIISDMEFDECSEGADITNFEAAKRKFELSGYELPRVVFWNVNSRNVQTPVTMNEQGVVLVSGCSPRIFSLLKSGRFTAYEHMMYILGQERYSVITA